VLEGCRICVTVVEAGLPLQLVLEIRLLLVPSSESGWSYSGSAVVIVLVLACGTRVVAEGVFSSVGQYRLGVSRIAVRLSFLSRAQARLALQEAVEAACSNRCWATSESKVARCSAMHC
jgi:hypothetical protein